MKAVFSVLLLSISFQLNLAMAAENIIGTWQGELPLGSGRKVTLQFLIQKDIDGAYSAVLSLPDKSGTGDIEASSVMFRSGKLTFEVPRLSGSYDGMLKDGEIVGQWQQEGEFIQLDLSRFELSPLSDEDKEKLFGKWYGKDDPRPGAIGGGGAKIIEFEVDEDKNFKGTIRVCFPDGRLDSFTEITKLGKNGDNFIFKVSEWGSEFKGRFVGEKIAGMMTTFGWSRSYTITKGEYSPVLNTKSDLPDSVIEFLLGKWDGTVEINWNERDDQPRMVVEFDKTESGNFQGHIISRDQFDEIYPITEAIIRNEKLILKTEDFDVQFEMKLSGNTLTGEWNQGGDSHPFTIVKE